MKYKLSVQAEFHAVAHIVFYTDQDSLHLTMGYFKFSL